MPTIRIDQNELVVPEGATILQAAEMAGISIPTLCYLKGIEPQTSCLVCVVRVNGSARLVPSCATKVTEGMVVESESATVRAARRTALELLLAEHAGECFAPCSQVCPAHLDIPEMMRQIRENDLAGAIITAREALVLPATLGYVCPGLCEKGCRRGSADDAVSICALHRFTGEKDLAAEHPWMPPLHDATGKRIAIVGAGPAGLAAAYDLTKAGHACTVFDSHPQPGGTLRYGLEEGKLPASVLDAEVGLLAAMGIAWRMGVHIPEDLTLESLRADFDAVALTGPAGKLPAIAGLFLSASAASQRPHAVQAIADGKELARQVNDYLAGRTHGAHRKFAVRLGALSEREMAVFMASASTAPRTTTSNLSPDDAAAQAERCMLCGCESTDTCGLRRYAAEYGAEASRYRGDRRPLTKVVTHPELIFEEGKCISCGLCIAIAKRAGEPLGLCFIGRGFAVTVAAPLNKDWSAALTTAAFEAADACPSGAIHRRSR